ncbi:MAG: MFS transporter [Acidisphaera sp.]|nr:MFS transporter [Acidisphaera sp.]
MTSTRADRAERVATTAAFFVNGYGIGAWAASIPGLQAKLGLSSAGLSAALFAFAAGSLCALPVAGLLAPKFGTGPSTRTMMLVFAVALLAPPLARDLPGFAAAALAMGAASGALDVAMNAHGSIVEGRRRAAIMSSLHAAFSGGGLLGAGLASASPLRTMGGAAALGVVLSFAAWRTLRGGEAVPRGTGARLVLPGRATLTLGAAALLSMLCEGAAADWSGVYLRAVAAASPGRLGAAYAAFSAAMLVVRLLGDRVVSACGPRAVVGGGGALAAAGMGLAAAMPAQAATLGFGLLGLGLANIVPTLFSAAGRLTSTAPSAGVAAVATAGYAGFLVGPAMIGAIAQAAGLHLAMSVLVLCPGLIVVVAFRSALGTSR